MTRYLRRQGNAFYARIQIPKDVQTVLGQREFIVSLGTDSARAHREVGAVVTDCKRRIYEARRQLGQVPAEVEPLVTVAISARDEVVEEGELGSYDIALDDTLEKLAGKYGVDEHGYPLAPDHVVSAIRAASRLASGDTLLSDQERLYLEELQGHRREQTLQDKRRVYAEFNRWLKDDPNPATITRRQAGAFVTNVLAKAGKSQKTVQSEIIQLSALWSWMEGRGVVEQNIWHRVTKTLPRSKRGGTGKHRRAFTEAELQRLFSETPTDDPIWVVSALGAYAGLRIEESCAMLSADAR
jgi:hypothetical protein